MMQLFAVFFIGAFVGVCFMAVLSLRRSNDEDDLNEALQVYGLSIIEAESGGWFCTSGPSGSVFVVGSTCSTPLLAVESAVAEIEGAH